MNRNRHVAQPPLGAPILVNKAASFITMLDHLQGQSLIAIDTESNSLYRYYPKVCLIQLTALVDQQDVDSTDRAPTDVVDYLVDPLALTNLEPLGRVLQNPAVEVIMHAAENDILILQRDFHFQFHTIFDTQLAARILGWPQVGLAALLKDHFGVESDKRMQRTDWGKRPLNAQQIIYAQMDTHFLPALRARMVKDLKEANRWEEAQESFAMLRLLDYHEREQTTRSFWQMRNTRDVPAEALNVLEALWNWREEEAQRRDRPPFKVATDQTLIGMAIAQPQDLQSLSAIAGLGTQQIKQYGKTLLAVIADGQQQPQPEPPTQDRQDPIEKPVQHRYDALRQWRTSMAEKRGVAPEIIFSNSILLALAQRMPKSESEMLEIPEIGPWKAKMYSTAVLTLLHKPR
ncbi:MAG: HRDC domain-containing protein [Caldilineaceae bacterium]